MRITLNLNEQIIRNLDKMVQYVWIEKNKKIGRSEATRIILQDCSWFQLLEDYFE
mgnify:CR=1 FL=1